MIHPETYPDEGPTNVTVPDRSSRNWTRVGRETAGEAGIHVMLWANGFVPREDDLIATDYDHRLSAGWDGDTLVAYADSTGRSAAEGAYVWRIVWANESEARAFVRAYRTMLLLRLGGSEIEPGAFVTEDEPFVDAFRVSRTGETVTVVNAPTVEALDEVHAPTAISLREVHAP